MIFVGHDGNVTVVNIASRVGGQYLDGSAELDADEQLFGKPVGKLVDGVYTDDGKFIGSFDDYRGSLVDKAFDEAEHPRDEHGRWTDAGDGGDESTGGSISDPSVRLGGPALPSADIYKNPGHDAIKNLTKGTEFKSLRFVIDNKGTLRVGDASKLSHQQINPAYMTSEVVGRIEYSPSGGFSFEAHGPYDMIPRDHPLLDGFEKAGIRNRAKGDTAFSFVSPNVKTDLQFSGAVDALVSTQQEAMRTASADIDRRLELKSREVDVVGAWADGAENSLMMATGTDWDHLVLSAAMKAHVGNQKSALVFRQEEGGKAALSSFHANGTLESIHTNLLKDGLTYHTLIPTNGGATVYVADLDGSAFDAVNKSANRYGSDVNVQFGRGQFIGDTEEFAGAEAGTGPDRAQRDRARQIYERIVEGSKVQGSAQVWNRVHHSWGKADKSEVKYPETAKLEASGNFVTDMTGFESEGAIGFLTPEGRTLNADLPHRITAEKAGTTLEKLYDEGTARIYASAPEVLGIEIHVPPTAEQVNALIAHAEAATYEKFYVDGRNRVTHDGLVTASVIRNVVRRAFSGGVGQDIAASFSLDDFIQRAFDEAEHPRDEQGRWTDAGGGGGSDSEVSISPIVEPSPDLTHGIMQSTRSGVERGAKQAKANGVKALTGSVGHPNIISSAWVTATKAHANKPALVDSSKVFVQPTMQAWRRDKTEFEKSTALFVDPLLYPNLRSADVKGGSDKIVSGVLDHIKSNISFLFDKADKAQRGAAVWYYGARSRVDGLVDKYKVNDASVVGVYAVLSPRTDWDTNVYVAEKLIAIHSSQQNHAWDKDMEARRLELIKRPTLSAYKDVLKSIKGQKLSALTDPVAKAAWIRIYDEAHSSIKEGDRLILPYNKVNADGTLGAQVRRDDGKLASASWGKLNRAAVAVTILESNGDPKTISTLLGQRHKVRSFYNDILDPFSANKDVVGDIHAVGAAWFAPLNDTSAPVLHAFALSPAKGEAPEGWKSVGRSGYTGVAGTYPIYVEAYRQVAEQLKLPPHQVQAVVWTVKRDLFERIKKEAPEKIREMWKDYSSGKQTLGDTQQKIWDYVSGPGSTRKH